MPSRREEIAAFVTSVLAEFLEGDVEGTIDDDAVIGPDGLGVESIGILEVVVHLEREYDMSIPDEVIDRMAASTFGVLVDEIVALLPATEEIESRVG